MRSRRDVLAGGCLAAVMASLGGPALAGNRTVRAPRVGCTHGGCRNHRRSRDGEGICGLALRGEVVAEDPHMMEVL